MRKVLFFSSAAGMCLVSRMALDLVSGLRDLGLDATLLLIAEGGDAAEIPERAVSCKFLAFTDEPWWRVIPASTVFAEIRAFLENGGEVVMDWNAALAFRDPPFQRIAVLTDAPYSKLAELRGNLSPQAGVTTVDLGHTDFLRDFGIRNPSVFVPHGGPSARPTVPVRSAAERDVPILFVGNLLSRSDSAYIRSVVGADNPAVVREIFAAAVDMASDGVEPYSALRLAALQRSVDLVPALGQDNVLGLLQILARWVESNRRFRLLSAIRRHPVHLVGQIGEGFFGTLPDTVVPYGFRWGSEVLTLMRRARITLNTVGVFPGGSHERIWYGMHSGSLVATDPSDFMAETFEDGHNIVFLQDPESADDTLGELLARPDRLDAMTADAMDVYLENHTWRERAARIVTGFGLI